MRRAVYVLMPLVVSGCARVHAPLPPPSHEIPPIAELAPVQPGQSRLVVDANGELARVTLDGQTVCPQTPCALSVPKGAHRVTFFAREDTRRFGDVELDLGDRATVVRHRLTVRHDSPGMRIGSLIAISLGASLVAGGGLVALGQTVDDSRPWATVGGAIAVTGLIGVALGVTFALAGRSDVWPGSTSTFPVPNAR